MRAQDTEGGAGPESPQTRRADPRRTLTLWLSVLVGAVLAFVATVIALNATVYSASGFVDRYLQAIERRDVATLLGTPGVSLPEGVAVEAIDREQLAAVDRARVASVADGPGGRTVVDVDWRDGDRDGTVRLILETATPVAGLFTGWRFASSPLATVPVVVQHASSATINGVETTLEGPGPAPDAAAAVVPAFVPSRIVVAHESRYLTAEPVRGVATGSPEPVTLDVRANETFAETVQAQLDGFLDDCAEQRTLMPAGCPFGEFVEDRLLDPPSWSILQYPSVQIVPGETLGTWLIPPVSGTARVEGRVLSLFDGSESALDEEVGFSVDYRIELDADGSIRIAPGE